MRDRRSTLTVCGSEHDVPVIVEPWADEYAIPHGNRGEITAIHSDTCPTFSVEHLPRALVVWVNEGGTTYEFRLLSDTPESSEPL